MREEERRRREEQERKKERETEKERIFENKLNTIKLECSLVESDRGQERLRTLSFFLSLSYPLFLSHPPSHSR